MRGIVSQIYQTLKMATSVSQKPRFKVRLKLSPLKPNLWLITALTVATGCIQEVSKSEKLIILFFRTNPVVYHWKYKLEEIDPSEEVIVDTLPVKQPI